MYMSQNIKPGDAGGQRPIGYWLKHLDRLIEETFSQTLASDGLTRRHWQILNTLARGPAPSAELTNALDPFVRHDPAALDTAVDDLANCGWVSRDQDGRLCLTQAGQTAHQQTQERVQQTRGLILRGVSTSEYATVIDILTRMSA